MEYRTVKGRGEDELVEKKSRFIGHIAPAASEEEALRFLEEIRASNREASHNCYAYVLRDGQIKRYSDDGEPQGTAGVPILDVLLRNDLVDACIVVTRYFGGTLLGTGGLVRAYSSAASLALQAGGIMEMKPCVQFMLNVDYSLYGKVTYLFPKYGIEVIESLFGEVVTLSLLIREDRYEAFGREMMELSSGTVEPEILKKYYADMK